MSESTEGTHPTTGPEPDRHRAHRAGRGAGRAHRTGPGAGQRRRASSRRPPLRPRLPASTAAGPCRRRRPAPRAGSAQPSGRDAAAHQPVPPPAATPEPGPVPTRASTQPPPAPAATDAPPPEPAAPSPPVETPQAHQPVPPPPATPEPGPVPTPASTQPPQPASTPDPSAAAPPSDPTAPPVPPPPARPVPSPTALAARPGPPRPTPAAPGVPAAGGTAPAAASPTRRQPRCERRRGVRPGRRRRHGARALARRHRAGRSASGPPATPRRAWRSSSASTTTSRSRSTSPPAGCGRARLAAEQAAAVVKRRASAGLAGDGRGPRRPSTRTGRHARGARRRPPGGRCRREGRCQGEDLAARETIAQEAESLAESTQWKSTGERFKTLLETWKDAPRADRAGEQALWKRFSHARSLFDKQRRQYFAQLDSERGEAKQVKEAIVAEAEALATRPTGARRPARYRDLMARWKAAGRAGKADEERLWDRFRAAQDAFFAARNAALRPARRRVQRRTSPPRRRC